MNFKDIQIGIIDMKIGIHRFCTYHLFLSYIVLVSFPVTTQNDSFIQCPYEIYSKAFGDFGHFYYTLTSLSLIEVFDAYQK